MEIITVGNPSFAGMRGAAPMRNVGPKKVGACVWNVRYLLSKRES